MTILCTIPICVINPIFTSGVHSTWKFCINAFDNATNASAGQGKNQSIVGQDTIPGNLRARTANFGFIGDIHIIKCKLSRTLSIKYCFKLSCVSSNPTRSLINEFLKSAVIANISSFANKPGISPVKSTELIYSKKTSSLISDSVNKNVVGLR